MIDKTLARAFRAAQLVLAMVAISILAISCGGGGGENPPVLQTAPGPIPGLCSGGFEPAAGGSLRPVPESTATPSPLALSTCSVDGNRNVIIGSGGCGPNVYVDKSFTGSLG